MVRVRPVVLCVFVGVILALLPARPAAAQTVSQTTCGGTSGINSCLTNGFLQDLVLDCSAAAPAGLISTALAQITDREGPNRITVSGTCTAGFNVTGFDRLTILGSGPTVTITKGVNIINSRNIVLQSLVFDFATSPGQNLNFNGSQGSLIGVTVKNSTNTNAISVGGSGVGFAGAASTVTANACNGIGVNSGSSLGVVSATITNNGSGVNCGDQRHGISVMNGGVVNLANQTVVNGVLTDAPVDISGNAGDGIAMEGGTARTNAEGGTALIHIHDNGGPGMEVFGAAMADLEGHLQFDGNNPGGSGFGPAQIVTAAGASLLIGEGAVVHGGLAGIANSSMVIGDGGAMTLTGGASLAHGSVAVLSGANTIDTVICDPTSWIFNTDGASIIGANTTCLGSAPTGTVGPVGPQGPPGPVTLSGSFTATGAPNFMARFAGSTNVGSSSVIFDNNSGLIGVGTTSPLDRLHVQFNNTNGGMTGLAVQNTGNTATSYSGMLFYDQNGALGQFQGFNNVTHEYRINNIAATGSINFMLGGSSKFLVASNGSIGIGVSSPAQKLQVLGDVRVGASGTLGCLQNFSGGTITGTCSSDERLKQNIKPFELVLDKLARIRPVSYEWRRDEHPDYHFGPERTTGLIAQEVEKVFPDMVAEDANGYKAVNYSELPLLLLQAVRELKAENERLRTDLEAQRQQLQSALEMMKRGSR